MLKNLLTIIFFACVAVHAQNCTGTRPQMNTAVITTGSSSVIASASGDNGCPTNPSLPGCNGTATGTITVATQTAFNSQTGYATLYRITNTALTAIYPIASGNNSTSIVLRAPGVANGAYGGSWISDFEAIAGPGARQATVAWSTPGFNSSTVVSYSSNTESWGGPFNISQMVATADNVTGVSYHSMTLDNLDLFQNVGSLGKYFINPASYCFTAGTPDQNLQINLPVSDWNKGSCPAGQDCGLSTIGVCTTSVCAANPHIVQMKSAPDVVANQNIFTIAAYNNRPTFYAWIPIQDGTHPGFRTSPGSTIALPEYFWDTTVPTSGFNPLANFSIADAQGAGLITNYLAPAGVAPATANRAMGSGGSSVVLQIPSNVPTSGTACTANGGAVALTLDDGVHACAFPLQVSANKFGGQGCGTTVVCGPPGTTLASCGGSPCSLPDTGTVWILVMNPADMAPPTGTVGPWINPNTGQPGIPCTYEINKGANIDNCLVQAFGVGGSSGNYLSYEGVQQDNCVWNGSMSLASINPNDSPWFYDGGYICHMLQQRFGQPNGTTTGPSSSNELYEQNILGDWLTGYYPRQNDLSLVSTIAVSGAATSTVNPKCTLIASGKSGVCSQMVVPVADATTIANLLQQGQTLITCFNTPGVANGLSMHCVFPANPPKPVIALTAGGNLPASAPITVDQTYSAGNGIQSYITNNTTTVTTSSTCPASGNCSVTVTSPAATQNATGYNVYAWTTGTCCWLQNTAGPVTLGTNFVIGTTQNPFQGTGPCTAVSPLCRPAAGSYNTASMTVLSADTTGQTITVDSAMTPMPGSATTVLLLRAFVGIPADAGSTTSQINCSSCTFDSITNYDVVYCGGGAILGAPLMSTAPNRGSLVSSVVGSHTINLVTAINCGSGVPFEIRRRRNIFNYRIFVWGNTAWDQWERFHNYMTADAVMWVSANTNCTTAPFDNCQPPNGDPSITIFGPGWDYSYRRDNSLALNNCRLALDIQMETGGATALHPGSSCSNPASQNAAIQGLAQQMDTQIHNGQYGNGTNMGSFLNGVQMWALMQWWLDPERNAQSDPRLLYWAKAMADALWPQYQNASQGNPACLQLGGTLGIPQMVREFTYTIPGGVNCPSYSYTVGTRPVSDYWSIYGNVYPMYAFLYQYTGNAVIPTTNKLHPGWTYGQAYADMASWGFRYANTNNAPQHPKTLGEQGLWQDQALTWMMTGSSGGGTSPLNITTGNLPSATVGTAYNATMAATGGSPPYSWAASGLPGGLTMSTTGVISGTPLSGGTSSVSITVNDAATPAGTASTSLALTVAVPPSSNYPAYISGVIP